MTEKAKKASWMTIFSTASVSYGIHVGGGFATGNQTVNYFVKYGWVAVPACIIAIFLINLVFRTTLITAQQIGAKNYREWAEYAFHPLDKVLAPIYDVVVLLIICVGIAASVAGGGSVLYEYGMNYVVGVIIMGVAFTLITIFGKKVLAGASTIMTIVILVCLLALIIAGLSHPGASEQLSKSMDTSNVPFGAAAFIIPMLQYVGYQSYTGPDSMTPYAEDLVDKKGVNKYFIVNFIMNATMICLSVLLLLAYYPQIEGSTVPIFDISVLVGIPWLQYVYTITLFLAFCSTGAGCAFGIVTRYENTAFKSLSLTARRALIAIIVIAISTVISLAGLTKVVQIGYGYLGYVSIPLLVIPSLTVFVKRYRNVEKKKKLEENAAN